MEEKLKGVVLRNTPYTDTQSLVSFLSAEKGKLLVSCHGARKVSGRNMPATQPFCFCEMIVAEKNGRYTLKESALLESFFDLRCDLLDCAAGSYFLELSDVCSRENEPPGELLPLLLNCLYALCLKGHDRAKIKAAFELRLLAIQGSAPSSTFCACCGKELKSTEETFFSPAEGGAVCRSCRENSEAEGPFYPMDAGCRGAAAFLTTCPLKKLLSFRISEKSAEQLSLIAKQAILYTFDTYFESLRFYEDRLKESFA